MNEKTLKVARTALATAGGKATLKKHGKKHFSKLAKKRWAKVASKRKTIKK